jgi:hypothetical protein
MFTESLTVRILGDSSGLQRELEGVLSLLAGFRESVSSIADAGQSAVAGLSAIEGASAPLQQVSKLIATITRQLQVLAQTPVTINVAPALGALQRLLGIVDLVASRLRMLSAGSGAGGMLPAAGGAASKGLAPSPGVGSSGSMSVSGVAGAGGFNTASALAVAPRFDVLSALQPGRGSVASAGGTASLDPTATRRATGAGGSSVTGPSTTNHFGGITINVREAADLNGVVRDLRLQGIHLRNRRG